MDKIKFYKLKLYRVTLQFVSIKCGREQLKSEKNQPINQLLGHLSPKEII